MESNLSKAFLPKDVTVILIDTPELCRTHANFLLQDVAANPGTWSVWAFDMEWTVQFKAGPQQPVGMIQYGREKVVLLFHIARCGMQAELVDVICHPTIFKLGVNIGGDVMKLKRDFACFRERKIQGIIDLRQLESFPKEIKMNKSLAALVAQHLHMELPKPAEIRTSNWDNTLTEAHKEYAALDVYISYMLYVILMRRLYETGSNLTGNDTSTLFAPLAIFDYATMPIKNVLLQVAGDNNFEVSLSAPAIIPASSSELYAVVASNVSTPTSPQSRQLQQQQPHQPSPKPPKPDGTPLGSILNISIADLKAFVSIQSSPQCQKMLTSMSTANRVEKASSVEPLTTSRQICYNLFMGLLSGNRNSHDTVLPISKVAQLRNIKETTAWDYLIDAVRCGWGYEFHRFDIPSELVIRVFEGILFLNILTPNSANVSTMSACSGSDMHRQSTYGYLRSLHQSLPKLMEQKQHYLRYVRGDTSPIKAVVESSPPRISLAISQHLGSGNLSSSVCAAGKEKEGGMNDQCNLEECDASISIVSNPIASCQEEIPVLVSNCHLCKAHGHTGNAATNIDMALTALTAAESSMRLALNEMSGMDSAEGSELGDGDAQQKHIFKMVQSMLIVANAGVRATSATANACNSAKQSTNGLLSSIESVNLQMKRCSTSISCTCSLPDNNDTKHPESGSPVKKKRIVNTAYAINRDMKDDVGTSIGAKEAFSTSTESVSNNVSADSRDMISREITHMRIAALHLFRVLGKNWPSELIKSVLGSDCCENEAVSSEEQTEDCQDLQSFLV